MNALLSLLIMFIVGIIIDVIWISKVAKKFYKNNLNSILLKNSNDEMSFRALPAVVFYLIYLIGIFFFVIIPSNGDLTIENILRGTFFGLVCYATYDLTNYATLKDFTKKVVIVDMLWGSFLTTIITIVGLLIY